MAIPSLSHQTDSLERLNRPFGLAKGRPLSVRIASGRLRLRNRRSKANAVEGMLRDGKTPPLRRPAPGRGTDDPAKGRFAKSERRGEVRCD